MYRPINRPPKAYVTFIILNVVPGALCLLTYSVINLNDGNNTRDEDNVNYVYPMGLFQQYVVAT